MNKFMGIGYIGKPGVQLKFAAGTGKAIAKFSLSIQRNYSKDGKKEYDFINCVAFDKTAEFLANNESKIKKLAIEGHIQTGSYTNKEGKKVYTTDVIVEREEVVEWQNETENVEDIEEKLKNKDVPFTVEEDSDIPF